MRLVALVLLCTLPLLADSASDEKAAMATVQQFFDAMKTHDASLAASAFAPGATLVRVSKEGAPQARPFEKVAAAIGAAKQEWMERIYNPTVLVHGEIAIVWGPFDFYLAGKLDHCGVDSFSLVKTSAGWKISYVADTNEKAGCERPGPR